jgi:6-phosphogluconolactonase
MSLLKPMLSLWHRCVLAVCGGALLVAPLVVQADHDGQAGAVYTMSNAPAGNAVIMFNRASNGVLAPAGSFPTGGTGTGGGLGNQNGLVLDQGERWLHVVNAGSNDVSVLAVEPNGLSFIDRVATGGVRPVSLAVHRGLIYVLNAGSDNLTGFRRDSHGRLTAIAGSTRALSGIGTDPAQAEFSPDGNHLVVTEKATNRVLVYPVDDTGLLGPFTIYDSPTPTPFGFAFGKRDQFFVSEAAGGAPDASTVSSYQLAANGMASLVDPSVPTTETAACWVVVTGNGRFAYVSNTGSGSISGYRIAPEGGLELLNPDGRTAETGAGSAPIDLALSAGHYLYSLNSGNGTISAFRVEEHGALQPVATIPGIPAGANGLAAR